MDKIAGDFTPFANELLPMLTAHKIGLRLWEGGKFIYSPGFADALGFAEIGIAPAETMEELRSYIHPDDQQAHTLAFAAAQTSAEHTSTVRYRCVGPGGTFWILARFYAPVIGKVYSLVQRSDQRAELEDKVKKLEDRYRKLVNTLPDFIFVFDRNFDFQDIIMPDGMTLLHSREELLRSNGRVIFTEEVSELYISNIAECLRTHQMREIEYYLDINSVRYYFQARIVPFEDDKVFALIHDIGDRVRRMEELLAARRRAEEADRMKSAFLANMSHEIRTPLNAIVGFAEVLATEDDPQVRNQYIDIIRTNSELMLQLINDILDLSRIESGKMELNFEQTEINVLLDEVARSNRMKVKPGVELLVDAPKANLKVYTDRKRVTQVLFNFLSNAIKNTERGSITIRVTEEEHYLRFAVADTGRGIHADKLKTIFNRFEKANDFVQGTGLGLSISESLVERLGGEIGVESQIGRGSTFFFTIPYRSEPADKRIGNVKDVMMRRKRVLVAEDSDDNFEFIRGVLGKTYDLIRARNGEEAVGSFILENPDLVLMNIQLPVMSGIEATKKIRAISSAVPVIGITANAFYMEQQWALESGCNDIISKPYSATKLEEVVLAFS